MIKRGYTLSETLIALGIIAVVSAITIPMLANARPDSTKLLLVKKYNELVANTEQLLSDATIYAEHGQYYNNSGTVQNACTGLDCTATPTNSQFSGCNDANTKYMCCLQVLYGGNRNNNSFTTSDGTQYSYDNNIMTITLTRNDGNDNCTYGDDNCNKPNVFTFDVNNAGMITPRDNLSRAYFTDINKNKTHNEYMNNAGSL